MDFSDVVAAACKRSGEPIPNTDADTGIAYGVASGGEIPGWFWDDAEPFYRAGCGACGELFDADVDVDDIETCPACGHAEDDPSGWYGEEPSSWYIDGGDFQAETTDGIVVMVFKSPRVVECRECSPCYPCAGDLGTVGEGSKRTYAFPEGDDDDA